MGENNPQSQDQAAQGQGKVPLKDLLWRLPAIAIFAWLSLSSFGAAVQLQSGYNPMKIGHLASMCWWAYLAGAVATSQVTVTIDRDEE